MIEEYLNSIEKEDDYNMFSVKEKLIGEKVKTVFQYDERLTMFLLESNSSFGITADGTFMIFSKKRTDEIVNQFKEKNKVYYISMNNLDNIDKSINTKVLHNNEEQSNEPTNNGTKGD